MATLKKPELVVDTKQKRDDQVRRRTQSFTRQKQLMQGPALIKVNVFKHPVALLRLNEKNVN